MNSNYCEYNVINRALAEMEMSAVGCTVNGFLLILQGSLPDVALGLKAIAVSCSLVKLKHKFHERGGGKQNS